MIGLNLESKLLKLIPINEFDFEELYQVASDPLIWEQHPQRDRYKREVFREFFDGALVSNTSYKIWHQLDQKVIGSTRFYDWNEEDKSCAIGYTFLDRAYWGGETNALLKKMMLDEVFRKVEKVYFHIGMYNIRSQKAVLKLGAVFQDVVMFDHYGKKVAHHLYVIEKHNWI